MNTDKKILFYDTKPYDIKFFDEYNQKTKYAITYLEDHLNQNTADFAKGFDIVCAFVNDIIDKKTIAKLKKHGIKLIALRCAGYNNVDLNAAFESIPVVRVPGYSPYAVAEHGAALMLSLNRKTHKAYYRTIGGNFSINGLLGFDLHEKTIGIIGTGQIGKCFISIAKGFGLKILAYDKFPDKEYARENNITYTTLNNLYKKSDIISLHAPLTNETHHMINSKSISLMKKGVMLINTSRGGLIDSKALINALKTKHVGAAGLDVYEEESEYFFEDFSADIIDDDILARLLTFPNVLITAHQGFFTTEALTNISETTLNNISEFYSGGYLKNEICYQCDKKCIKKAKKRCF